MNTSISTALRGTIYKSPIGNIKIFENDNGICQISFGNIQNKNIDSFITTNISDTIYILDTIKQLDEYFKGQRFKFDIKLNPIGTKFQQRVWKSLCNIQYGETQSYEDIAISIGNPKGCRAVGMANNKNPIAIVIPCHRVIGKNGSLTGYAGGVEIKKYLLDMENKYKNLR